MRPHYLHVGDLNNNKTKFQVFFAENLFLCQVFEEIMSSKRKAEKDEASSSDDSDAEVRNFCILSNYRALCERPLQGIHV